MSVMDLQDIPFDKQNIVMDIGTLSFDQTQVVLLQEPETVAVTPDFYMPEFTMRSIQQSQAT